MNRVVSAIAAILLAVAANGIVWGSGNGGGSPGAAVPGNFQSPVPAPSRYSSGIYSRYPSPSYRPGTSVFYSPVNGADYRYRRTCPYKHWHFLQDDIILGVFRDFGR